jgi:EamA-like transporter family.
MPLFAIPISYFILNERPSINEVTGIIIGFFGLMVYTSSLDVSLIGAVLTITNAIFWAMFTVYYRKLRGLNPLMVNASQFLLGSLFFLIYLVFGKPKIRRVKIWNNGVNDQEEYTAFAMSNNIRLMLRKILKPEESGYLPSYGINIFWEYIYKFSREARNFGEKFGRALINSSISWYIVYIIIVLIIISLIITI